MSPERIRLTKRGEALALARSFFADRSIIEVDPSHLRPFPTLDTQIEVIEAEGGFLHTSPEYAMKQMLSRGSGDIYFLGHVYRKGEKGWRHHPEFTMAEWYRVGVPFLSFIEEVASFVSLFIGPRPLRLLSYREAWERYVPPGPHPFEGAAQESYLMATAIEPHLGAREITALIDYPPEQAALARLKQEKEGWVAERFELYVDGVEICNGYHELADGKEQRRRFELENRLREERGQKAYPLDEEFLASLDALPDCSGVAVGFDRLLQIKNPLPLSQVVTL
jgi:lysyl-tRNA synthetase class 2